jgi:integrase
MARRSKGEGSIYKMEGRRGVRAQVTLRDGRRLTRQFPTSAAAAKWIRETSGRTSPKGVVDPDALTLAEWMEIYLQERRETRRPATVAVDQVHWRNHFLSIRDVKLHDLDHLAIRSWLDALQRSFVTRKRPLGQPHTVRLCYSILRSAFGAAVERDLIEANPMTRVKRPAVPRAEPKYLEADDLKRLLAYLATTEDPRELAVQLMIRLGLRRGEALGLSWGDVDLHTGRIAVALQLQRVPDPSDPGRRVLARVPLKTSASRRSVRASGTLLERLRREHAAFLPRPEELVVQFFGRPVDPQNLTQWLSLKSKEIGIACSPHRLRHTAATLMLNETGSIATVSSFLGHTELRTTSVYARVLSSTSDDAAAALGEVVDRL